MPPEQLRGHASYGSDLYSLGCTLLYLLTRRSPADLPLQRMKINFRSSLNISEQFADWLDIILEPAVEDRFNSTEEALKQLNNQQASSLKPLVGSSIQIKKKSNNLIVYIPPKRKLDLIQIETIAWLGLILIGEIFFIANFSMALNSFFITILVLLNLLCVPKLIDILFAFFGRISLKIEPHKFQIVWNCLGRKRHIVGNTASIEYVTLKKEDFEHNAIILSKERCIIYSGLQEYKFGMWLTKVERRWLVTEIANFVVEQYPTKNKEAWLRDIWQLD